MNRHLLIVTVIFGLSACANSVPTASQPGATGPEFDIRFNFPEGSACSAETSTGTVAQNVIPGAIRLAYSEKTAPISCVLPNGEVYQITTHQRIPASSRVSAGITVYPDDRAFITADVDGSLAQLDLTGQGTIRKQ